MPENSFDLEETKRCAEEKTYAVKPRESKESIGKGKVKFGTATDKAKVEKVREMPRN